MLKISILGKERWKNKEWSIPLKEKIAKSYTKEVRYKIAEAARIQKRLPHLDNEHKKKISIALIKTFSDNPEINIKKSIEMSGVNNPYYGRKHNNIIREKIRKGISNIPLEKRMELNRISRINTIKQLEWQYNNGLPIHPSIGKKEKETLDKLEKLYNIKIIRQYKVSGYFIDGYIPELNIALEYDEKFHNHKLEKDIIRQNFIEKELNCKFIRIKEGYEENIVDNFSNILQTGDII